MRLCEYVIIAQSEHNISMLRGQANEAARARLLCDEACAVVCGVAAPVPKAKSIKLIKARRLARQSPRLKFGSGSEAVLDESQKLNISSESSRLQRLYHAIKQPTTPSLSISLRLRAQQRASEK